MRRNQQTKAPRIGIGSYFRRSRWMMLALAGVVGIAGFTAFHSSRPLAGNEVEPSPHPMGTAEVTALFPTTPIKSRLQRQRRTEWCGFPAGSSQWERWIRRRSARWACTRRSIPGPSIAFMSMASGWIRRDVTNEEFARFVKATGYVTIAERKPTRGGVSRCATGEPGRRLGCLHTARITLCH